MKIQRWEDTVIAAASSGGGGGGDEEDTPEKIAEMARKASNRGTVDIAPESTDDDEDVRISPKRSPERPHDAPADDTRNRLGSNIFEHVIIRIGHIIYSCNPVCHLYIYIYIYRDRYIYIHILPLRQLASDRNECAIDFYFVNLLCCNGTSKLSCMVGSCQVNMVAGTMVS